ncbi:DNA repair protein RecN [bacterium]|nr:DNA repair protein RecN [bacterium]
MLQTLKVKNYALIEDVELRFDRGLNIITGETGAGKSILIESLGLVLGKRADSSALRSNEKKCVIEAEFEIKSYNLKSFFIKNDLDYETVTLLRREITPSGKSRAFINDTPVKLKTLESFGVKVIEIHSQHDNLQLFKKTYQYELLDTLSGILNEKVNYREDYNRFKQLNEELKNLKERDAEMKREEDFNQFLFDELEAANIKEGEEERLRSELELLENAEELIQTFKDSEEILSQSDFAVLNQLENLRRVLNSGDTDISREFAERLKSVIIELNDINDEISRAGEQIQLNPEKLEEYNERVNLLFNLKQKHRVKSEDELLKLKDDIEAKLLESGDLAEAILKTEKELQDLELLLWERAKSMHKARVSSTGKIEELLHADLSALGMQHSRVRFDLQELDELSSEGCSSLEIMLSADKGAHFSNLNQAASGGELSRISLCFKSQLAKYSAVPSSIYDEIDTGVSGEIARKMGSKMTDMANNQQLIVITHLVQIASLGNRHFFIYKEEREGKVKTTVRTLDQEERIHEIAKMISGSNLTESALEQSRALLND